MFSRCFLIFLSCPLSIRSPQFYHLFRCSPAFLSHLKTLFGSSISVLIEKCSQKHHMVPRWLFFPPRRIVNSIATVILERERQETLICKHSFRDRDKFEVCYISGQSFPSPLAWMKLDELLVLHFCRK